MCVINSIAWNWAFVHVTSYITININIYIQRTTKYFRHIHAITIQSGKDLLGMCNGNLRRLSFRHSAKLHTDFPNQISICYVDDAPASSVGDKWFRPLITLVRLCNMCIVYCKSYDVWQYWQWNMRHVGDDGNKLAWWECIYNMHRVFNVNIDWEKWDLCMEFSFQRLGGRFTAVTTITLPWGISWHWMIDVNTFNAKIYIYLTVALKSLSYR